jgi:hypothetical protein
VNVSLHEFMRCGPSPNCRPGEGAKNGDLVALVRLYRLRNRPRSLDELKFFQTMPSLELAVHNAALATDERGKRFGHQCRIPASALRRAKAVLSARIGEVTNSTSFHDLHAFLKQALGDVRGLGELYFYDTALRLGSFLGFAPEFVYLHRGTRAGARALGLDTSSEYLTLVQLPARFACSERMKPKTSYASTRTGL